MFFRLAIEVLATSGTKISQVGRTIIDVFIITGKTDGFRFSFEYDKSGNYYNANWEHAQIEEATLPEHNIPERQSLPTEKQ